jgi:DNA repair protein RadA/Sms
VREAATQLLFAAKGRNVPILLVGHVTKEGSLAGPKALEHVVDTVLYSKASATTLIAWSVR